MLNAKLLECYKALYDRTDKALRELCDREGSNLARDRFMAPHLIGFSDEAAAEAADLRVMFFGQETAAWKGASLEETVENYVCFYNDFREYANLPESCWQNHKSQFAFWTAMRKMRDAVVSAVPTGKVSFIWNNICKIAYDGGKDYKVPPMALSQVMALSKDLILDEIAVIKPDMLVFFTGTEYNDEKIEAVFNTIDYKLKFEPIDVNGDARIFAQTQLPGRAEASYVSCHPSYAQFVKTENGDFIIGKIAEQARTVCAAR